MTATATTETPEQVTEFVMQVRAITWEVRQAMKRKKMTRAELVRLSGLSSSTLDRRLDDTGRTWTVPELAAVAEHLDTTVTELVKTAEYNLRIGRWMNDAKVKSGQLGPISSAASSEFPFETRRTSPTPPPSSPK